jgi:hypothetical protein
MFLWLHFINTKDQVDFYFPFWIYNSQIIKNLKKLLDCIERYPRFKDLFNKCKSCSLYWTLSSDPLIEVALKFEINYMQNWQNSLNETLNKQWNIDAIDLVNYEIPSSGANLNSLKNCCHIILKIQDWYLSGLLMEIQLHCPIWPVKWHPPSLWPYIYTHHGNRKSKIQCVKEVNLQSFGGIVERHENAQRHRTTFSCHGRRWSR